MSHLIEPQLAGPGSCFVYDYPASQAALARVVEVDGVAVGQRFELYVDGMELANGYFELSDPVEQRRRFELDNARRRESGQPERPLDEHLLAALEAGLPSCSGVALGVDRLLMLAMGVADIREVLAFDWERA
jgi:lysyl-tRNA synthetase class 2